MNLAFMKVGLLLAISLKFVIDGGYCLFSNKYDDGTALIFLIFHKMATDGYGNITALDFQLKVDKIFR